MFQDNILSSSAVGEACRILKNDELVAFPTETVYGLGGNAYSDVAVSKIFACKNRPAFNPISVCYSSLERAGEDVEITETALRASKFLPGPLTLVLKRKANSRVSWLCSAGTDTLGIRVPNNPIALEILRNLDFPLAAPSANKSREMSATTAQDVAKSFSQIAVIDGGPCKIGIESTIIDLTQEVPTITRLGAITIGPEVFGVSCKIADRNITKHYQTKKKVIINTNIADKNDGFLGFGDVQFHDCKCSMNLSISGDVNEAGQRFFTMLHQLESENIDRICIAPIPNEGIGQAINAKLQQMIEK